jgi:hypothetical protein
MVLFISLRQEPLIHNSSCSENEHKELVKLRQLISQRFIFLVEREFHRGGIYHDRTIVTPTMLRPVPVAVIEKNHEPPGFNIPLIDLFGKGIDVQLESLSTHTVCHGGEHYV